MKHHPVAKRARQGLLAVSCAIGFSISGGSAYSASNLNPDADEILQSMSSFLAATPSFGADADGRAAEKTHQYIVLNKIIGETP